MSLLLKAYNIYFILIKIRSFRFKMVIVLIISGLDVCYSVTRNRQPEGLQKLGISPKKNTICSNCGTKF